MVKRRSSVCLQCEEKISDSRLMVHPGELFHEDCWAFFCRKNGIPIGFQVEPSNNEGPSLAVIDKYRITRIRLVPDHVDTQMSLKRVNWK